jgi:hypothetical protein
MMHKTIWSTLAAAALLAACAQKPATPTPATPPPPAPPPPNAMLCNFQWCPIYVEVTTTGTPAAKLQWDEVRMQRAYSDGTLLWTLYAPDYEFRANSVTATGQTAPGAWAEFPVRQITDTRFALDGLNKNNTTYTYEVRVYKKGAPPDAAPLIARGTVVNAAN